MTRRDWWIVGCLVLVLLVHALVPRYEYRNATPARGIFTRIDRWTGNAELVTVSTGKVAQDAAQRVGAGMLSKPSRTELEAARAEFQERLGSTSVEEVVGELRKQLEAERRGRATLQERLWAVQRDYDALTSNQPLTVIDSRPPGSEPLSDEEIEAILRKYGGRIVQ